MHILEASFLLIVLIVLSNIISHYLISIPTALIEIGVGLIFALVFRIRIDLEADWFMLLFVAPLLYNDAKRFPKKDLWELRAPIFANAILLVILTTILGGYVIHWLIPFIPLPLTMALAAVLSPTDPVAVHGIAEQVKLPQRILSLISGESLINDASGLIAFKYALSAFLTGSFSLFQATSDFFYMLLIGIVIGIIMVNLSYFIRSILIQQGIKDVILHTTIMLVNPFLTYMLAEYFHASGVIAVVTAGVISIRLVPLYRGVYSEINLITNRMWDILVYLLNGAVFIILGAELPIAMSETLENPAIQNWKLIGYIFLIWLILLIIRILWSYAYLWITYLLKQKKGDYPYFHTALLTGLTGVRGAITMATIMSLPFMVDQYTPFYQRSLIIFLACGVVLMSLVIATCTLPLLTKQRKRLMLAGDDATLTQTKTQQENQALLTEIEARTIMMKAAVEALKEEQKEEGNQVIVLDLLHDFERRLRSLYREQNDDNVNNLYAKEENRLRKETIAAEMTYLASALAKGEVSDRVYRLYKRNLTVQAKNLKGGLLPQLERLFLLFKRRLRTVLILLKITKRELSSQAEEDHFLQMEEQLTKHALAFLKEQKKNAQSLQNVAQKKLEMHLINQLSEEYRNQLERLRHIGRQPIVHYQAEFQEYYMKALNAERSAIQELYEDGKISLALSNRLRQIINYSESALLQSNH